MVLALGASWAIDGLEVTLKGAVSGVLQDPGTLGLSSTEIGVAASAYLLGALIGTGERLAVFWGYATGTSLMLIAEAVAWRWCVDAERVSLESVAAPLSQRADGVAQRC